MEIIQQCETFKEENGKLQFCWQNFYVRHEGNIHYGTWDDRSTKPTHPSQLRNLKRIKTEDIGPEVQETWAVTLEQNCHFKAPGLNDLHDPGLEDTIRREVEINEILRRDPHPNIATYYGCREKNGHVTGLCFKRYKATMYQRVNPDYLNKDDFRSSARLQVNDAVRNGLVGILDAIKHLHSLGLVHNDLNPSNIMFDELDVPVIIDFGSCRRIGESLVTTGAGQTDAWHDPTNDVVLEKNDLDAFEELKSWLVGSVDDAWLFPEEQPLERCYN
jgi:serine/threonine protein kinase